MVSPSGKDKQSQKFAVFIGNGLLLAIALPKRTKMYYFAYGSNLNKKQMRERCPDSKPKLIVTLPNYKLVFAGWSRKWRGGVATIKRFSGGKVPGAIYEVSELCLRRLDKYEDGYGRFKVTVFSEDGEPIEAITYIKSGQLDETPPTKEYVSVIQQGYRDWGIV